MNKDGVESSQAHASPVIGCLGIVFRCDRTCLFMKIANWNDGRAPERLVEVHRSAANNQEDMLDAQVGDELDHIVGELHGCSCDEV